MSDLPTLTNGGGFLLIVLLVAILALLVALGRAVR